MATLIEMQAGETAAERKAQLRRHVGRMIKISVQTDRGHAALRGKLLGVNAEQAVVETANGRIGVKLTRVLSVVVRAGGYWLTRGGHRASSATATLVLRLRPSEKATLAEAAARRGCTLSSLVRDAALAEAGRVLGLPLDPMTGAAIDD